MKVGPFPASARSRAARDGRVDGDHVLPVDDDRRQAEAGGALRDGLGRHGLRDVRLHGVQVVLAHRDQRKLPQRRQVDELPGPSRVRAAVAEVPDGHPRLVLQHHAQRGTHGQAQSGTDDAVGAQEAPGHVDQVHAPTATAAAAVGPAEELRHDRAGSQSLGQGVVVAAVRAGDEVVGCECADRPHRDRLLAFRGVDPARNPVRERQPDGLVLEPADHEHLLQPLEQVLGPGLRDPRRLLADRRRGLHVAHR